MQDIKAAPRHCPSSVCIEDSAVRVEAVHLRSLLSSSVAGAYSHAPAAVLEAKEHRGIPSNMFIHWTRIIVLT